MITVNGKKKDLEKPMTVTEYLNENSYVPATVAIELNEEILERELYGKTILREGDIMEIVQFMGGGSGLKEEKKEDKKEEDIFCKETDTYKTKRFCTVL